MHIGYILIVDIRMEGDVVVQQELSLKQGVPYVAVVWTQIVKIDILSGVLRYGDVFGNSCLRRANLLVA